jgi:hypothetical protein
MSTWQSVRPYFEQDAVAHVETLMPDGAPVRGGSSSGAPAMMPSCFWG